MELLNYFHKNTKLPKIDLAVLGKDVDKFDEVLIKYISDNKKKCWRIRIWDFYTRWTFN